MKLDVTNAAFQSSCQEASLSVDGAIPHYDERRFSDLELTILVCKALRVWSEQRNAGEPVQPALYALLSPCGLCILAPVFDGLFSFAQMAMARPLSPGAGCAMSADEAWLVSLIGFMRRDASGWTIGDAERSELLEVAVRCTRLMVFAATSEAAGEKLLWHSPSRLLN